jgi:hypothetical protein
VAPTRQVTGLLEREAASLHAGWRVARPLTSSCPTVILKLALIPEFSWLRRGYGRASGRYASARLRLEHSRRSSTGHGAPEGKGTGTDCCVVHADLACRAKPRRGLALHFGPRGVAVRADARVRQKPCNASVGGLMSK